MVALSFQRQGMGHSMYGKPSTAYGMEISAEKTKLMTNNTRGIKTEIRVNGQKLETVTSFKYLGSVMRVPSLRYSPG